MAMSGVPQSRHPDLECLVGAALRARRTPATVVSSASSGRRFELVKVALASLPEDLHEEHLGDILAATRKTLRTRLPQTAPTAAEALSITTEQAGVLLKVLAGMSISDAVRETAAKVGSTGSRWIPAVTERIVDWVVSEDTRPRGLEEYLRFHIARCSHIDPRGLRRAWQSQGIMLPLTDVYSAARLGLEGTDEVAADQALTLSGLHGETLHDELIDDLLAFEEPEPGGGESFARLMQERRWLVVLGDPGAGKTTLLKWLSLKNAQAMLNGEDALRVSGRNVGLPDEASVNLGPTRLPVLVRVADYADELAKRRLAQEPLPGIYDFLGKHKIEDEALPGDSGDRVRLIQRHLQTGRALVLFDGLDEITDASMRELIARRIDMFIREYVQDPAEPNAYAPRSDDDNWWRAKGSQPATVGGNQLVVTSRRAGYKEAALSGQVTTTKILPLREDAIRRFTRDWCLAAERHRAMEASATDEEIGSRAAKSADVLASEILGDPRISRLATNPLLLTMLAFVREERGPLPTRRSELYDQATKVLARRRQAAGWSADEVITILGPFALWLQQKSNKGYAPEGILREHVKTSLPRLREDVTDADVDEFVRSAREHAGLLVETGSGRYGFMHGTFREYLAAREIARAPDNVQSFLQRFLHAPRWAEVLPMCAAIASANRPETADDVLKLILEHDSPLEDVLRRDLLFAASCLHEMQNVTPALAGEVVDRVLDAAAWAGENRFGRLQQRLTKVLSNLSASLPHITMPRLYAALRTTRNMAVAVQVARGQQQPTAELLDALDAACRSSRKDAFANSARSEVARAIFRDAVLDEGSYEPVRTLLEKYKDAMARLEILCPAVARLMRANPEWVNPDLREAYQWLLARVPQNDDSIDLRSLFVRELLARARIPGSELAMLWSTARALDRVAADRWLLDCYASGSVDLNWAARCFAFVPAAFPSAQSTLERWFEALPVLARRVLLEQQTLCRDPSPLVAFAWQYVVGKGELAKPARALLCRQAVTTSGLPGSSAAFEMLGTMLAEKSDESASLGRALLPRLGKSDLLTLGYLQRLAGTDSADLRSQQAAIMLSQHGLRFSATEYDLVAKAIADRDGPLRGRAIASLNRPRAARAVDDATIRRSWHHRAERLAAGDGAAANIHGNFGMFITHADITGMLRLIAAAGDDQLVGRLTHAAVRDLMTRAGELQPEVLRRALACCRLSTRGGKPSGADTALLAPLCNELSCGSGIEAARLLGEEAVLTGSWTDADRAVSSMIDAANLVSAIALVHAAAWQLLPDADNRNALLAGLRASEESLAARPKNEAESRAFAAAALLVACASSPLGPEQDSFPWVSGAGEAAAAILDALTTDKDWVYPPPPNDVRVRLASFTVRLAKHDRGMRAIIHEVSSALRTDDGDWERRRAALFLADTAAAAYPALFLLAATPELRQQVLAIADDAESYSVRRLSVNVLSHFRRLDSDTLAVIARACRDLRSVSAGAVARCQSITLAHQPDIGEISDLMDSEHQPSVMAAALLLSTLARSRYVSTSQKATIEETLASAVRSPNPATDVMGLPDGRSLRSWLHDLLTDVAWREKPPDVAPILGSWAVTGAPPTSGTPSPRAAIRSPTDALIKTIHDLPKESGSASPSAAPLKVIGKPLPSWDDLELGDLPGPQLFHLARSMYYVLEFRVGSVLAHEMTDAQLDEFETFIDARDDQGAFAWLRSNFPSYKVVVGRCAEALIRELLRLQPEIRRALRERFEE